MIVLPKPYTDELLYSWFARYYIRSGYVSYRFVAEDLYVNPCTKPNPEFWNKLTDDAVLGINRYMTLEDAIMKHTMFPQNARFLSKERKRKGFALLLRMDKEYNNALYIKRGHGINKRWLRYCPLCAGEDRTTIGETYWHREHQLIGVDICTKHNCRLVNSNVEISSKPSPSLMSAELEVPYEEEADFSVVDMGRKVAKYVVDVFRAPVNFESDVHVGQYLHSTMEYTKYVSTRGLKRNMVEIYKDFIEYYKDLPNNPITEQWQLESVFLNRNMNLYDVCSVAMFLGVTAQELVDMQMPQIAQNKIFDAKVRELHARGLNYRQIADEMNTSYDLVKLVGLGKVK